MRLFIMNGTARTGKDTFIDFIGHEVKELYGKDTFCISSVGKVKEAAYALGWDGVKDEKGRKFLSDLKDLSTEAYDGAMKYMESCMNHDDSWYFFMVREPVEIAKFVQKYPEMRTILLTRPDITQYDNHADALVAQYPYDYIVNNDGTLEDLEREARLLVAKIVQD